MKNILKLAVLAAVVVLVSNTVDAKTLSVGSTGQEVVKLQTWLINNGYPIPLIESGRASKGYFGTQTQDAVKMYQEGNEQNPTGVIDSENYGNTTLKLGSVTGPDTYFPYTANNNVKTVQERKTMVTATSTPCAYYFTATSSLEYFALQVSSSTSVTSTRFTLATSSSAFATTSKITDFGTLTTVIPASAQSFLVFRGDGTQLGVISPNTWLVLSVQGGTGLFGTAAQVGGVCQMKAITL